MRKNKIVGLLMSAMMVFSMSAVAFAEEAGDTKGFVEMPISAYATSGSKELTQYQMMGVFEPNAPECTGTGLALHFEDLIPDGAIVTAIKVAAETNPNANNYTYDFKLMVANELDGLNPKYNQPVTMPGGGKYITFNDFNGKKANTPWFANFKCKRIFTDVMTTATVRNIKLRVEYTY